MDVEEVGDFLDRVSLADSPHGKTTAAFQFVG